MTDVVKTVTSGTPCSCCAPPSGCLSDGFQCRDRGGDASLCGFDEFADVSTPPKKYRTKSLTGVLFTCNYSGTLCTPPHTITIRDDFNGVVCSYDAATCATSMNQDATRFLDSFPAACPLTSGGASFPYGFDCSAPFPFAADIATRIQTATQETVTGSGGCGIRGSDSVKASGSVTLNLTDEDTADDAIARLLAGPGGTWSAWGVGSCVASYEDRTGFSFHYTEAQWRIFKTGLLPNAAYSAVIEIWRAPWGTPDFVLFQTIDASGTSDPDGNLDMEGDVPLELGFDTYALQGACPPPP